MGIHYPFLRPNWLSSFFSIQALRTPSYYSSASSNISIPPTFLGPSSSNSVAPLN